LPINIAVSFLPLLFGGLPFFEAIFLTIGFLTSLLVKEVNYKNEYSFYNNNGISNIQLWILSYIVNFFSLVFLVISINLIMKIF
jgi:hypothetical protein